jgi:hypothetical protein
MRTAKTLISLILVALLLSGCDKSSNLLTSSLIKTPTPSVPIEQKQQEQNDPLKTAINNDSSGFISVAIVAAGAAIIGTTARCCPICCPCICCSVICSLRRLFR